MNPFDEAPVWQEVKRLREQLDYANERHTAALEAISKRISQLEAKLTEPTTNTVESAAKPPPIPKTILPELRKKAATTALSTVQPLKMEAVSLPDPPYQPAPEQDTSFELDFGKVWFVRIGIVILLTGLVFLGNHAYQSWIRGMPSGVRLAALFACSLGLVETGRRLAEKENLRRFGEVLLAGGMAFFYYCTFAAHHVGRLKVIESPAFGAALLFGAAAAIAAVSWLRKAPATAILGIVLASYSTMLQPIGWMSCVSSILLGGLGLVFMFRPGWSAPGWASMLGSYGAFFGWQLLGASGETMRTDDPAVLWFLPPLWLLFAIPGILGRFRESLSDRARAWFTGANNAFFFLLFTAIWIARYGDDDYWKVAGVFGPLLIALGVFGRRQGSTAGGVNISQGLAVATFAVVLKLEGQHLALVLAFESLALAVAAWRFRGKGEAVFSLLAGLGSVFILGESSIAYFGRERIPVWSGFLAASLIGAASVAMIRVGAAPASFARFSRASAALLFIAATLVASQLCLARLEPIPALLTAIGLSGILSHASLILDKKRLQPEIAWAALWFLCITAWLGIAGDSIWPLWLATAVALASCRMWHRQPETEKFTLDPAKFPAIPAWAFSLAVPFFAFMALEGTGTNHAQTFNIQQCAAIPIAAFAIAFRCKRLLAASSATMLAIVVTACAVPGGSPVLFIAAILATVSAAMIHLPWSGERVEEGYRSGSSRIFRTSAFIAYCAAWYRYAPDTWSDWLALTSVGLTLGVLFQKRNRLPESVALVVVSVAAFAIATATSPWHLSPQENGWRGIAVVIALLSLVLTYRQRPAPIENPEASGRAIAAMAGLTCAVTTVWATQMLVWRFGWKPAAVLWTVLGFAFVSAGLWQRLHVLRVWGFLLLVISFGKLFTADVWDFTTFMRVVSFIVLGAALILLGLFYNKFAYAIKALLDDEKSSAHNRGKPVSDEKG